MASDGCQPPDWHGRAFSYLPFAPSYHSQQPVQSYAGSHSSAGHTHTAPAAAAAAAVAATAPAAHGAMAGKHTGGSVDYHYTTIKGAWFGPAPQGYQGTSVQQWYEDTRKARDDSIRQGSKTEPKTVALRGGAQIPLVGLGTYALSDASTVTKALQLGYRHLDCSPVYGNEVLVGQGLKAYWDLVGNG